GGTGSVVLFLVLLTIQFGNGHNSIEEKSSLISDGMHQTTTTTTTVTCEATYGFLPCTTTLWGQLFLMVVYEYLLYLSANYVSKGSELFFETFGTGLLGASLFQMIGLIPQLLMVIVSGVSASEETVASMATMGMGLNAGSVVMTLTLVWGSIIAFGSYNLSESSASSNSDNTKFFRYGVTTDVETKHTARIMMLSVIPFLLLQLAKILSSSSAKRVVVLIALIVSLASLIGYCTYQVFQPWIQNRRLEYLMRKYIPKNLVRSLRTADGKPNEPAVKQVFHKIDKNSNTYVSTDELRVLILGIQIEEVGLDEDDFLENVMEEFDVSDDSQITEMEFVKGLSTWLNKSANQKEIYKTNSKKTTSTTDEEQQSLLDGKKKKESKSNDKPWINYTKAAFLVTIGTGITTLLALPTMETIYEFSTAASIPSFLVSYVVLPIALSYRQSWNAITSARQKTEKATSLTFSETYAGVIMNNLLGISTFLLLVYIRDLTWDVSTEVLVVLIFCTATGLTASFITKFPFWTSIIAYILYPLSILLIYLLTDVLGWS
ncbi:hypothetical protein CFOL_v3_22241, partial [Cephalotus follicularis]